MNQDLLSGGSSRRRRGGPGGPAARGNASSSAQTPQQGGEEGDEEDQMNRVVEVDEQRRHQQQGSPQQQRLEATERDGDREEPWAHREPGASRGPRSGAEDEEEDEEEQNQAGRPNEVNGGEKGARWQWEAEQRSRARQPQEEDEEEEEEEEEDEEEEEEEEQQDYDQDDEEEEDEEEEDEDGGMGEGEESNEGSGEGNEAYEGEDAEGADDVTDPGTETEESLGASDSTQRAADSQTPSFESSMEVFSSEPNTSASRMPQSPRRPPLSLPPRLNILPAPPQELGPPAQFQRIPIRRPSVGRGLQLTPGMTSSAQLFFEDDDRMVPSTPTLPLPHRSDGFAEAIHSPQVAGVSRFRFGLQEDVSQTSMASSSSSHSDLGQLASQGGLGIYDSPLFLATQEEESGGRSVSTTPLQVAAPVTVFPEMLTSEGPVMASQSVAVVSTSTVSMVSTSTAGVAGQSGPGPEERDDVFMEGEGDRASVEASLESVSQGESEEPFQPSDDASLPSTSQEPSSSSADPSSSSQSRVSRPPRQLQRWTDNRGRTKRGQTMLSRGVHGRRFAR